MKLIGGPMDGHEEHDDVAGIFMIYPIWPNDPDAHCFSYRATMHGPVEYTQDESLSICLGWMGPSIQRAYYSVRGQWLKTECSCGEVVAMAEGGDPPGPPRARPPEP